MNVAELTLVGLRRCACSHLAPPTQELLEPSIALVGCTIGCRTVLPAQSRLVRRPIVQEAHHRGLQDGCTSPLARAQPSRHHAGVVIAAVSRQQRAKEKRCVCTCWSCLGIAQSLPICLTLAASLSQRLVSWRGEKQLGRDGQRVCKQQQQRSRGR